VKLVRTKFAKNLMSRGADMVNAKIMKQQGSSFWAEEQSLETRHI
jgi:hypothetical protein